MDVELLLRFRSWHRHSLSLSEWQQLFGIGQEKGIEEFEQNTSCSAGLVFRLRTELD